MSEALLFRANGGGEPFEGEVVNGEASPAMPATMDLEVDVHFHAQHITVLHLKEPTAKQYRNAQRELVNGTTSFSNWNSHMRLIAEVANVPMEVVEQLPASKVIVARDFLERIMAAGLPTGLISSPI